MENRPSGQRGITLRLDLLGGFAVRDDEGREIAIGSRKGQALLAFLALPPGKPQPREKLTGLLWSDRGEQQARSSLRQALTELRKAFVDLDPPPLITDRDTVHIDPDAVEVDAVTFDRLVDKDRPGGLARAAELYRGDLLDGLDVRDAAFEEWLRIERERLRARASQALGDLLDQQTGDDAIATGRRLLALDPLKEATHCALMRLYAEAGDRSMAIKQYGACREVLQAELGLKPETATQQLAEEIQRGETKKADSTPESIPAEIPKAAAKTPPLPDKPSVAVLPFVNMSGDPEQEYFSDGITEDIITELSRFRDLFVIARNSSFVYRGKAVNLRDVGRELGVRYVVEGSVRKAGARVRVSAQLIDAVNDRHIWAERYDRELEDIFAVQDEISQTIVSTLAGRIEDATRERAKRKSPDSLLAYDYVLRGDEDLWLYTEGQWLDIKERIARSRQMFLKAIELDPDYARAYEGVAYTYAESWGFLLSESPDDDLNRAFEYAQKAVALDDAESRAHYALALTHVFRREYEQARAHQRRAVALNPNDADTLARMGWLLPLLGEHEEGIELGERALRLNPYHPAWYQTFLPTAYYAVRRYHEAITAFESARDSYPDDAVWRAACYAQSGRLDKARALMADFLRSAGPDSWWLNVPDSAAHVERDPTGLLRYMVYMYPFKNPSDLDHLLDGLRKAGLPE
jgi:TolB-like protein